MAELGQAFDQGINGSLGQELVFASEGGEDALAGLTVLAIGLGDLEVLVEDAVLDATLKTEEHTIIII